MSATPQLAAFRQPRTLRSSEARVAIGQALVDKLSFQQAHEAILRQAISGTQPAYIVTANAQHIVLLNEDAQLREIYRHANLVVPDGVSLLLAARLFGQTLPERVTGVDLFQSLSAAAATHNLKLFFLGGQPGAADQAAMQLRQANPNLRIETCCPPFGFENSSAELNRIDQQIRAAQPHIVFAALGAPKQERWIYDHGRKLGVNVCIGIGGSFEMIAGLEKRAPRWLQKLGGEWLYRLCKDPRNKWRRYTIGNLRFLQIVLKQRWASQAAR
jgi:N-acetylglucosaminyldiphosphoundecaprenol N-acetyl-beta-D-mannosaminyltransferase